MKFYQSNMELVGMWCILLLLSGLIFMASEKWTLFEGLEE